MRVGILTYHFAKNYGAVLQCYALQNALSMNDIDVSVINYISDVQRDNNALYGKHGIKKLCKNILLLPFRKARNIKYKRFDDFLNNNLRISRKISSINELHDYIENQYDVVLVGSDQVWNPKIDDFDSAFMLPFDSKAKKISYAASLGGSQSEDLKCYKKYISDFDYITVREDSAVDVLKKLGIEVNDVISDPVFLLDKDRWKCLVENIEKHNEKYIVCYFLHQQNNHIYRKIVEDYAKDHNVTILNIVTRFRPSSLFGECIYDAGPKEFISLLDNAEYIFTDSFHGTAFSIVLNKQFTCFCQSIKSNDNRKKGMLEKVGLENRICYLDAVKNNFNFINYDSVQDKLQRLRNEGIKFIMDLEDV